MDAPDQEPALLSKLLTKAAVRSHGLEEFVAAVGTMLCCPSFRVERVFLSRWKFLRFRSKRPHS